MNSGPKSVSRVYSQCAPRDVALRTVALEATLGMAFAADGRLDGCHEAHINAWDVAAGLALVAEAGGWCSDFILAATPVVVAPRRAARPLTERRIFHPQFVYET